MLTEFTATAPARGLTPNGVARLLRVSPDRVRAWIARGELAAVNTATAGAKPRYIVLPQHLAAWEASHRVNAQPVRRRRRRSTVDCEDFWAERFGPGPFS
jgi:hypothetical protein